MIHPARPLLVLVMAKGIPTARFNCRKWKVIHPARSGERISTARLNCRKWKVIHPARGGERIPTARLIFRKWKVIHPARPLLVLVMAKGIPTARLNCR